MRRHAAEDWSILEVLPTRKQPAKLPVVPSPEEVVSFLDAVPILRTRVVLTTRYAAGLRISEAVSLRPTDIDSRRMVVRVEQGTGARTATSCSPRACWRPCTTTGGARGLQCGCWKRPD